MPQLVYFQLLVLWGKSEKVLLHLYTLRPFSLAPLNMLALKTFLKDIQMMKETLKYKISYLTIILFLETTLNIIKSIVCPQKLKKIIHIINFF